MRLAGRRSAAAIPAQTKIDARQGERIPIQVGQDEPESRNSATSISASASVARLTSA
jgi:hypothetical protein